MHKELIAEISNLETSKKIIKMLFHILKKEEELYECAEEALYIEIKGEHLDKEMAECWVSKMDNNDGTKGAHWNLEQTNTVARQLGIKFDEFNEYDWYASLNMVYSDYYNPKFDSNIYAQLAKDWIMDKDVPKGKTYRYYKKVVEG